MQIHFTLISIPVHTLDAAVSKKKLLHGAVLKKNERKSRRERELEAYLRAKRDTCHSNILTQ